MAIKCAAVEFSYFYKKNSVLTELINPLRSREKRKLFLLLTRKSATSIFQYGLINNKILSETVSNFEYQYIML